MTSFLTSEDKAKLDRVAGTLSDPSQLKSLGSGATSYTYDGANKDLLERFPNPLLPPQGVVYENGLRPVYTGTVAIEAPEFTSLCPLTGQPDFATIVIRYRPGPWCVESKSLKLYLGSFRQTGEFHEACVQRIAQDLWNLLDPIGLEVRGEFTPRGGIKFWPEVAMGEAVWG